MIDERKWMLKYLGERFMFFRKEKGYSREQAANILGVSARTLAAYERGEREISMETTKNMAAAYGVTFEHLTDYQYLHTKIKNYMKEEARNCDRALL